jgi:hypothetical protein
VNLYERFAVRSLVVLLLLLLWVLTPVEEVRGRWWRGEVGAE